MLRFIVFLSAMLFLAGCTSMPFLSGEIRLTADELTQRLARRFPLEKSVAGLLDVTLGRPSVELNATEQRIATSFDIGVKLPLTGKNVTGVMKLSGRPEYVVATDSLFLRDARVDQIRMDNMPEALSAALAKAASNFARDVLEDKALYTFKPEELRRYGARFEPQRIEVRPDALVLKVR